MENNKKKLSIGLIIAMVGFPQISETIYTPALPNVVFGLQTTPYLVEATLSIYFLGFALGVLTWGTISDYCGRRIAMLFGIIIYGIGTLACANVENVGALLAWRFLQAFGASVGSVITQTILRDSFEGEERTKLFAIMSGALAFSPALGPVLGGFLSEFYGWRANFWALVILSVILTIWTYKSLPETRPAQVSKFSINKMHLLFIEMFKSRALWGHVFLIGATNGILFGFYQEAPFVFIEQMGIKPSLYGLFGLLIASTTVLAARISYKQSMRYSAQSFIQCGAACVLAGGLLLTLAVLTGIFNINIIGIASTVVTLFAIFFGIGLIIPNSLSHALKPYQMAAGTAGSIFGGAYYCLIAAFTWIMSVLHNGTAFPLPLYISLLGVILVAGGQMIRCKGWISSKLT